MTEDHKRIYAESIWTCFLERTGGTRLMSSVEFSLVRFWWQQGVPLRLVLGALRDAPRVGRTLMYMEASVAQAVRRSAGGL